MSTLPVNPRSLNPQSKPSVLNTMRRQVMNQLITVLSILATVLVIAPLVAILVYLVYKGASSLNLAFFTHIPAPVGENGGGMANSIVG
jgi:phosphate transport system permease protein